MALRQSCRRMHGEWNERWQKSQLNRKRTGERSPGNGILQLMRRPEGIMWFMRRTAWRKHAWKSHRRLLRTRRLPYMKRICPWKKSAVLRNPGKLWWKRTSSSPAQKRKPGKKKRTNGKSKAERKRKKRRNGTIKWFAQTKRPWRPTEREPSKWPCWTPAWSCCPAFPLREA